MINIDENEKPYNKIDKVTALLSKEESRKLLDKVDQFESKLINEPIDKVLDELSENPELLKEQLCLICDYNHYETLLNRPDRLQILMKLANAYIETYDDSIGRISVLTYILCERDRFSVDIRMNKSQLTRFPSFIKIIQSQINSFVSSDDNNATVNEDNYKIQLTETVLSYVKFYNAAVLNYPSHHIDENVAVSLHEMANMLHSLLVFTNYSLIDVIEAFLTTVNMPYNRWIRSYITQLATLDLCLFVSDNQVRCACGNCEMTRKLKKCFSSKNSSCSIPLFTTDIFPLEKLLKCLENSFKVSASDDIVLTKLIHTLFITYFNNKCRIQLTDSLVHLLTGYIGKFNNLNEQASIYMTLIFLLYYYYHDNRAHHNGVTVLDLCKKILCYKNPQSLDDTNVMLKLSLWATYIIALNKHKCQMRMNFLTCDCYCLLQDDEKASLISLITHINDKIHESSHELVIYYNEICISNIFALLSGIKHYHNIPEIARIGWQPVIDDTILSSIKDVKSKVKFLPTPCMMINYMINLIKDQLLSF